MAFEALGMI
jgi:dynein assembly factor 3, axonemal